MKLENSIGWCDDTGNKVIGCTKVSEGCKNCYAETGTAARVMRSRAINPIETWGAAGQRLPVAGFPAKLRRLNKFCICDQCHTTAGFAFNGGPCIYQPAHAQGDAATCAGTFRRIRLFADSNSDWLDAAWPIETFAEFLDELRCAPNVDILLLTKRIELWGVRIESVLKWCEANDCKWPDGTSNLPLRNFLADWFVLRHVPAHLWLGVSVENQQRADERIPQLLAIQAAVRFLSCEPLLEPVDLNLAEVFATGRHRVRRPCGGYETEDNPEVLRTEGHRLDWVIVGGESGKGRRECELADIESVAVQCATRGVPVYVKQDCAFKSGQQGRIPEEFWKLKQFPNPN